MKEPPRDPFELQAHIMSAVCADLGDLDSFKRNGFARTDALRAVLAAHRPAREAVEQAVSGLIDVLDGVDGCPDLETDEEDHEDDGREPDGATILGSWQP